MSAVTWIELPVSQMDRAVAFYHQVLGWQLQVMDLGELRMAIFPTDGQGSGCGGALVENSNYAPSTDGALIYFYCEDVQGALDQVGAAGGVVIREKTAVSDAFGYMALAMDTEGNRIAFHSKN